MLSAPDLMGKLAVDPSTRGFLAQPDFMAMLSEVQKKPNTFAQHMNDPRMMKVLSVALGINVMSGEEAAKGGFGGDDAMDTASAPAPAPAPRPPPRARARAAQPQGGRVEAERARQRGVQGEGLPYGARALRQGDRAGPRRNLVPHQQSRRFLRAGGVRRVRRDVRHGDREGAGASRGLQGGGEGDDPERQRAREAGQARGSRGGVLEVADGAPHRGHAQAQGRRRARSRTGR